MTRPVYEIYVPTKDNDGKPFRTRHHREWDRQVRAISGGLTIHRPAQGQWVNEGVLHQDRVIPVRIVCSRDQIIDIMRRTARHYRQLDVLAIRVSDEALFLSEVEKKT